MRLTASSTPGAKAARELVSWRIVSVSPVPPRITSWCATSPGSRTLWMGTSPAMRAAVASEVPDGASFLVSACSSTISAAGRWRLACSANCIISTAPIAKLAAWNSCTPAAAACAPSSSSRSGASPEVPNTSGTRASMQSPQAGSANSGAVKSTTTSPSAADSAPASPMPSEGAAATATVRSASASIADTSARPTRPEAPDRITRIIARSYSSGERRVQRGHGLAEAVLVRPHAGHRQAVGCEQLAGQRRHRLRLDRVDLGADAVERQQLGVGQHRLAQPAGAVRGRLHRQHDPPLQVLLGALQLVVGELPLPHPHQLVGGDAHALGQIVLAGADVDTDHASVGILGAERVDRVGHAAPLPDLLEQPGRGRSAQHRVEQRGGEAAPV